ncbi:hypothetical protein PPL_09599 [Heterostelium album PN500]|uniref:Uncharacterized protein n=1 Tax=Heterostelium pallidum (strain ATCC 26659 / Pp 5 / PN500) TaxID=670386 RepID=D3BNS8_HETP5|nr:hypothetical protein PPL_09599 [Heterostelium album PN500]EFA76847.1 hypothetical protein PPL_09599 [Heterostelium album PN500]|eukprot:XP_020428979.1 hypothetical protein PPL_09599 [Heterostelium album PN500]
MFSLNSNNNNGNNECYSSSSSSDDNDNEVYNFNNYSKNNNNNNNHNNGNIINRRYSLPSKQNKQQPHPTLSPIIQYNNSQTLKKKQQQQQQQQQTYQQNQQQYKRKNKKHQQQQQQKIIMKMIVVNLSDNLHQRIVQLEKGVGDQRITMNQSPPPPLPLQQQQPPLTSLDYVQNIVVDSNETKELLANCFQEISRLLERQHQYESLLAQREQTWEMEIDSIRMKLLDQNPNSSSSSLPSSSLSMLRDDFYDETDDVGSGGSSRSPSPSSSAGSSSSINYRYSNSSKRQLSKQQQQQPQQPQQLSIIRRVYLYVFGPQSNIWRKIIVISLVVIVWPIVSHFLWRAFSTWLAKRRARKAALLLQASQPLSNAAAQFQSTIANVGKNISSGNNKNNSSNNGNKKKKNISAPDIVKAFIQGVSTGDGGSNNNITNNAITSLSNTLNSLTPTSLINNNNSNSLNSNIVNSINNNIGSSNTNNLVSNIGNSISSSSSSMVGGTGSSIASHLNHSSPSPSSVATLSPTVTTTSLLSNSKDRVRDSSQRFMVKLVKNILKGDSNND